MDKSPKVAVVILNWNGKYFLEKFLPSVFNSTYPNIEFVIGDNGSSDDSVAYVKKNFPVFRIIENGENLGFAGGYNRVLEQVDADYYVLLNSDVEVTPGWIEPVIEQLQADPLLVACQPKILSYHYKGEFEHAGGAGGYIDCFGFPFCRGRILTHLEQDLGQYDDAREIFWATGAALFIKADSWKEANGFDADFFAHFEEIDLCWRLKRMGYKIGYCPSSQVFHVGGGTLKTSNPQKTYLNFRNNMVMLQKNLPTWSAIIIICARLWIDLFAIIKFLVDRKGADAWAVSRAHQYFFLHFFKNRKKRQHFATKANRIGTYKRSILWDFYVNKIHRFSQLKDQNFRH
ncbi:MAG TPA: glycosyltransferase family 2 protein [Candidatus Sphingobacterium stercorigallinarum]|nr:glycosyltransferase family 2 protein [Candidatus Sphingobacterium stercorigallinarum]